MPTPFHCLTLSLLLVPPLLITTFLFTSFPNTPQPLHVHPSLASLPKSCKTWEIYPEGYFDGGGYVNLPFGRVRYWIMGPEKGRKIVLIHGLSIPAIIWKDVAPILAKRGYQVLLYDLYGRGYSDAPQTTYDTRLYTTQLALLMQHLGWDKAAIAGVSMGGAITAAFAAQFPNLVEEIVLIASAGIMESSDLSRTAKFMSMPIVQTLTSSIPGRKYMQRLTNSSDFPDPITEIVRLQSAHLPGYNAALSSSLRDGPIRGLSRAFEALEGRRVLVVHGTKDVTVNPKYSPKIMGLLPESTRVRSKLVYVEGAGHDLTVSHALEVGEAMDDFLRR